MKQTWIFTLLLGGTLWAQTAQEQIIPTKHNPSLTLQELAEIQPGLGSVMIEFGHRAHIIYYAAQAKNWKLAQYELHEMIEAQEVAETTRPKYKKALKSFEDTYLAPLEKAIVQKDEKAFALHYQKAIDGCNACHKESGHPYIHYRVPQTPPAFLLMELPKASIQP